MTIGYWQKLRLFHRDVRLYLITPALIGFTAYGGIYGVVLNLYLLRLGYGPAFIGLVNGVSGLAFALASLPAGALGTRWGVRRAMIAGLALAIVGNVMLPLAEALPGAGQRLWLPLSRALAGLGLSTYMVNASPFLMATTGVEEREHAFSVQAALWPLAGFVGSLLGGTMPGLLSRALGVALDSPAPYRYTLLFAATVLAAGIPVLWATSEIESPNRSPAAAGRRDGSVNAQLSQAQGAAPVGVIVPIVLVGTLRLAGESGVRGFYNVYLDAALGLPTAQIGALMAVGQLLAVPAAMATPLVTARWGQHASIGLGTLFLGFCLLPLALVPHWAAAALSWVAMIVLVAIVRPAYMVYTQRLVRPTWQPLMSGATNLAAGLGRAAMLLIAGPLIATLGYRRYFVVPAALMAAGGLFFGLYFRRPRGALAE